MKTSRIICSIMLLLLGVALVGCSHKNAPDQELIEGKGKDFTTLSRSKAVDVVAEPWSRIQNGKSTFVYRLATLPLEMNKAGFTRLTITGGSWFWPCASNRRRHQLHRGNDGQLYTSYVDRIYYLISDTAFSCNRI